MKVGKTKFIILSNGEKFYLDNKIEFPNMLLKNNSGIYFLFSGSELMFIGFSKNLITRLAHYTQYGEFDFDKVLFMPHSGPGIKELCETLVRKYKPKIDSRGHK